MEVILYLALTVAAFLMIAYGEYLEWKGGD